MDTLETYQLVETTEYVAWSSFYKDINTFKVYTVTFHEQAFMSRKGVYLETDKEPAVMKRMTLNKLLE